MRRGWSTLWLVGAISMALPVRAHDTDACLPVDDKEMLVCRHHFAGTRLDLPVRDALDGIGPDCRELVVRVLQRQGLLLAEIDEPRTFDAGACSAMSSLPLELPAVRSEADIVVLLSVPGAGEAAIAVRVYPDTLLEPLQRFAGRHPLIVLDESRTLTEFFDHKEIEYVPGFAAAGDESIAILVRPRHAERLLEERGFGTAVIFLEKIVDIPQVRIVSVNGRTRVYVEMPFLHALHDSPLAQKALADIIRLAIDPISTDRG